MLEDAEKADVVEECEEEREWWATAESFVGSGASSPRPRVAMSSTKEGRAVMVPGTEREREKWRGARGGRLGTTLDNSG